MGTTDRPDLQLRLSKGEIIIVIGEVDMDGYYTAIFNGMSPFNVSMDNTGPSRLRNRKPPKRKNSTEI